MQHVQARILHLRPGGKYFSLHSSGHCLKCAHTQQLTCTPPFPLLVLQCRFKHTRQTGPPPDPELLEACKPREFRNISIVANQANEGILPAEMKRRALRLGGSEQFPALPGPPGTNGQLALAGPGAYGGARPPPGGGAPGAQAPSFVDNSLLAAVGQRDLRYGF